jgi:purine nucleoside permease
MPTRTFFALLVIFTGFLGLYGCNKAASATSKKPATSIILTAFGDKDATFGETQPFLKALKNRVDRTSESAFCQGVYEGTLSGQSVVVVTTGTGSDNSGPCMQELLYRYGANIKEVIWSGIGGVTPAVGGMVDQAGQMRSPVKPVMIGDVCISALSWNYDLHFNSVADWAKTSAASGKRYDPAGGWWPMKDSSGNAIVLGFENIQLFTIADKKLADELTAAAQHVQWPSIDSDVLVKVERYFSADQVRSVRVFDSSQCGEVSTNNFWYGVVEDRLSRQYLASLIAVSGYGPSTTSEDDVVALSAMESAAWMSILARWNKQYHANIPMAVVRAASDYDHDPLDANGNPKPGPDGKLLNAMDEILLGLQEAGASFAWDNAARPVLKLFELRSLAQQ